MIIRETYMKQILDFMNKPVVKVITGMRRTGKSVLLELTKEAVRRQGVEEKQIFSVNFESLQYENLKNYKALYEAISLAAKAANGKLYLFLDEIQEVESWEKAINSIRVDYDCDIYITGSNVRLLSGELATLLSGRYIEIPVYPLSFSEYLEFAKINEDEIGRCSPIKISDEHVQLCAVERCNKEKQNPRHRSARKGCTVPYGQYRQHILCKDYLRFLEEPREKTWYGDGVYLHQGSRKCISDPQGAAF
ncbi:MAG: AAA family ATPase [Sphaerochaetaceae bacterium]|nr:AAA family ATPase [Sphaerochaetaceae bacterium]